MATEFWARKTLSGLNPLDPGDDHWNELKLGEDYLLKIHKVRDPKTHRRFFALLKLCFNNQEEFDEKENHRKVFIMRCGYYDEIATSEGVLYMPRSISFESMDETEFKEFYEQALIYAQKALGSSPEEIQDALRNFY